MVDFNLQQFLSEMREENRQAIDDLRNDQRSNHAELSEKIDKANTDHHNHETRLVVLEGTHKTLRWFLASLVGASLGTIATVVIPKIAALFHP